MTAIHYLDARGPDGMMIFAIGDVHGRLDLLELMLAKIDAEIAALQSSDWRIILLGDYIDRGPNSKGVLDLIILRRTADPRFIALAGNHDIGMLEFLQAPSPQTLFAQYGGEETAESYGVFADLVDNEGTLEAAGLLRQAVPSDHIEFLATLPRSVSFGDFFFCHAGIRPGVALDKQKADDLIWIRSDFLRHAGLHPKVIVHGHTPANEPEMLPNRVNVDTYAYRKGVLTALVIDGAEKSFLTAESVI